MKPRVTLYTIQAPGHDLVKRCNPLPIYRDPTGPYYSLARYLGWKQWAWCFSDLEDFIWNNDWLDFDSLMHHSLWTLMVPYKNIVWCSLDRQCDDTQNVKSQIFPNPSTIRLRNEIPMGLVKIPIKREWVCEVKTARAIFWQFLTPPDGSGEAIGPQARVD